MERRTLSSGTLQNQSKSGDWQESDNAGRDRKSRKKLYLKAKQEPKFRFCQLWEKVWRSGILEHADRLAKSNGASWEWTVRTMERIGLTLNQEETKLVKANRERLDSLGYTFGPHRFKKDGHEYLGASPSRKSVARLRRKVREVLRPAEVGRWEEVRGRLNRVLAGWSNCSSHGTRRMADRAVDNHVCERVRGFLRRRCKVSSRGVRSSAVRWCLASWAWYARAESTWDRRPR